MGALVPAAHVVIYQTRAGAMWLTLLNLTGEFPTGDYTLGGRVVATFIAMGNQCFPRFIR